MPSRARGDRRSAWPVPPWVVQEFERRENVMNLLDQIESAGLKKDVPRMSPGDTVRVHVKVKETTIKDDKAVGMKGKGIKEVERERVQVFEGLIIGLKGAGARETITVRKVSFGEGVERIFPVHATTIEKIEVVKHA